MSTLWTAALFGIFLVWSPVAQAQLKRPAAGNRLNNQLDGAAPTTPGSSPSFAPTAQANKPTNRTSQILLAGSGQTALTGGGLTATPSTGATIVRYTITSIPNATTQGTLYVNNAPVTTTPFTVLPANANALSFAPVSTFFGTATFNFTARDNSFGATDSPAATYGIPVVRAACGPLPGQSRLIDYSLRTGGEDFTTANKTIVVDGVTVTFNPTGSAFTSSGNNTNPNVNLLSIGDTEPGKGIVWQEDYPDNVGNAKTSSVTLTFSQPVSNFSLNVGDLDRAGTQANDGWIDQMTFAGFNGNTAVPLAAADVRTGNTNTYSGNNVVTAANGASAGNPGDNVLVSFPSPITRLTITYANTTTNAAPAYQYAVITSMAWCANADVVTTLATAQTAVNPGATITYTATVQNNGPTANATGVAPVVQLPAGLLLTAANLPAGASYNNATGLVTLPVTNSLAPGAANALTYTITFTAPNYSTTIQGTASSTSTTPDPVATNNDGTAANANVQTVVTLPANGCAGTPYGTTATSGLHAQYYAGYFGNGGGPPNTTDNLGFFAANTPALTRTDANLNFAADNSWGNIVPPASGTVDNPELYSSRYRGSISIATAGSYTFSLTSDDASYLWLDGAALAATPTFATATINDGGLHGAVTVSATVTLSAGSHNLLVFFGENTGQNSLVLQYAGPDTNGNTIVVPNSVLCNTRVNVPPVAVNVTNTPTLVNNGGAVTIAPLAGTDQDGTVDNYLIVSIPTAAQGVLTLNGTPVTAGQTITAAQAAQLQFNPANTFVGNATFTFQARDNSNQLSNNTATYTIPVALGIAGTVFEDVNYGGGAGRSLAASGGVPRPGARVELYSGGTYVSATTTDANGRYAFSSLAAGNYVVRVVNNTVTSSRPGYTTALIPVQTFNGTTTSVGGTDPAKYDAANGTTGTTLASLNTTTTIAESQGAATVANGNATTGPDFGFNFDLVVNTNDVATVSGNNAQGTLRQFITNANALGGVGSLAQAGFYTNAENLAANSTAAGRAGVPLPAGTETSIFMIPTTQLTGGVATITLAAALPAISGANIAINGATQTYNIGNGNDRLLGVGGTVGTGTTPLSQLNAPEVQISKATGVTIGVGLDIAAGGTGASVIGLAINGFGTTADNNNSAEIRVAAGGVTIAGNMIGTSPTAFADLGAARGISDGIRFTGGTTASSVSNNLIGFNAGKGISVNNGVTNIAISNNEIRSNAQVDTRFDGIDLQGSSSTVTGNLVINNAGVGVDSYASAGSITISNNTVSGNGRGTATLAPNETAGIRIYGTQNTVSQNVVTGSYGAGVQVQNNNAATLITQNSIYNNGTVAAANGGAASGQIGIDLNTGAEATGTAPYVTINDNGDGDTGPNGLLNFPVITSATVVGSNLVVQGFARPGSVIEFFSPGPTADPTGFGEGQTYLGTYTEGSGADTNTGTGTYGPGNVNGLNQGTDNTNRFTFTIPLTGNFAGLTAGSLLTSTATLANVTSEFSGNVTLNAAPVPNTVTNVNIPDNNGATVLSPNLSSSVSGTLSTGAANTIQYYTITSLPATGTLTYNGTVLTAANIAATQITPALLNTLTYTPAFGVSGTVSFTYTSTDANGITSATNNNGGTITNGQATYTIPVVDVADVTTVVTGPATLNAGQPSGTYLASFTNNGPNTATGVTQKVTLPAGATLTGQQLLDLQNAYPGTTFSGGVIYFLNTPVTLASGATNSYSFAYTAPTATGGATLTSNVTTTTSQGTATAAPDFFNLGVTVNGVADVVATISGNGPKNVGALATFTATFTNNGPQAATNVVPTIQLPAGLANVSITPPAGLSIIYNSATGLVTFTATPTGGAVASLAAGAGNALTATVSYTQPLGAVTATAAISTTSNEAGLTANNQQAATINSNTVFDVATTISGPATATAGTQVAYNVTTSNNGPSAAPSVVQTITLPAGATNVFVTGNATISGSTVTFPAIASLAAGQTVNNTVSFSAPSANYSVVASVTPSTAGGDTDGTNNSRTASTTVTAVPDATKFANAFVTVAVGTTAAPGTPVTSVDAGTSVTFTVTEGNNGRDAATGVVTRVAIPTGLPITGASALKIGVNGGTPVAPTSTSGTVATYGSGATAITYDSSTGIVTSGTVATQATGSASYQTYALVFNAPTSGVVTATADVSTTTIDNVPANNLATAQLTVNPALTDVATTITGPAAATAGALLTYSVTTTNNGPAPANSVVQLANIPAGLPVTGANALLINGAAPTSVATVGGVTTATYGNATYNQNTGLVTFATLASQAAGATASNTIAYYAPANGNTNLTNTAEVSTSSPESTTNNNATVVATALTPSADVQVAILGPTSAVLGGGVTYTVVTTNNGPSVAGTVTTTVQLPAGLSGVVVRDVNGSALTNSTTSGYNAADGIVRFGVQTNQAPGSLDASIGTITFDVPANTNLLQPTATAVVTGSVTDQVERNNTATIATTIKPTTSTLIDMATSVSVTAPSANPTSVAAGTPVTFTVNTRNNTTGTTATNVVQTLELVTGLPVTGANAVLVNGAAPTSVNATTGVATYAGGATYDPATGLVTFAYATLNTGLQSNTVTVVATGATPLVATAVVRADQSEPAGSNTNNTAVRAQPVALTPDVATAITGPSQTIAGAPVSYTVVTSVAGLSSVSNVTQTVQLPAGVTSYSLNGGALVTVASGATITIPVSGTLNPGAANAVSNVITFAAPTSSFDVTGFATATGDAGTTGNNTSTQTTTIINKAPVAAYVVNTLQAPESNSANTNQLAISPLSALDPEGNALTYTITKAPDATQGRLYYNNGGTYTLVADGLSGLTPTQASTLRFDPTPGFVGNAAFQYTAIDALGAVSNTAVYLVPVGSDNAAVYTATPTKGGNTNQYQNGDVLAYGIDPNGAEYNTAGLIYSTTGGTPTTGTGAVNDGIAFGKLSVADSTALAAIGIRYTSGTGLFTVVNRNLLPRAGRSTTVSITTVDLFGGVTVQNFTLTTGVNPLPVELTDFTATAVKNVDAALVWHTASEKNNDHFDVERSLNGTDFVQIAQVKGQGSTAVATPYALTDAGIGRKATGLVYYRLKQVDTDGTATYSPVRTVTFTGTAAAEPAIGLYPNPATSTTQLDLTALPAGTYQVRVLDATGRVVLSLTREAGLAQALDVNTIASGTYVVLVRGQHNGQTINLTKRLIKE